MRPTVSIVIPAYNNAEFIEATLASVLSQTYRELEVIVADHESTDGTLAVLDIFTSDPRLTVVSTPAGGGAARNWNRVSELATGEYLKLVCGDDTIHPECVERQLAAFQPGVDVVASKRDIIDAAGQIIVPARGLPGLLGRMSGREAVRKSVRSGTNLLGEPASVMFRRAALADAGYWDARESYLIDQASYARVLVGSDFVGIDESLADFRVSAGQWSVRLARSQAQEAITWNRRFAEEHPGILSSADLALGALRARIMAIRRRIVYLWLGIRKTKSEPPRI